MTSHRSLFGKLASHRSLFGKLGSPRSLSGKLGSQPSQSTGVASVQQTDITISGVAYKMLPLEIKKEILDFVLSEKFTSFLHNKIKFNGSLLGVIKTGPTIEYVNNLHMLCRTILCASRESSNLLDAQFNKYMERIQGLYMVATPFNIYNCRIYNRNDKFIILDFDTTYRIISSGFCYIATKNDPLLMEKINRLSELANHGITITSTIFSWLEHFTPESTFAYKMLYYMQERLLQIKIHGKIITNIAKKSNKLTNPYYKLY